ncbi:hypothetical protein OSB04_000982 [Centaurea solstitialis]|uniref:Uncharacterized protein n=1 Tax=Centaurea solstitialis TaxID=347529 RepID=A0AA38U0R1_9ASTR|nr:hypothetical protein OSB04_000982 [Centaurea solstitialis]
MTIIHVFLVVVAFKILEVHIVPNAFLNGNISKEVFMKLPPKFKLSNPDLVFGSESRYTSPRYWFAKLVTTLKEYDFSFLEAHVFVPIFAGSVKNGFILADLMDILQKVRRKWTYPKHPQNVPIDGFCLDPPLLDWQMLS